MTKLERPVKRETAERYRGRPLVIVLKKYVLEIREKGRRLALPVAYDSLWEFACRIHYENERRDKRRKNAR